MSLLTIKTSTDLPKPTAGETKEDLWDKVCKIQSKQQYVLEEQIEELCKKGQDIEKKVEQITGLLCQKLNLGENWTSASIGGEYHLHIDTVVKAPDAVTEKNWEKNTRTKVKKSH